MRLLGEAFMSKTESSSESGVSRREVLRRAGTAGLGLSVIPTQRALAQNGRPGANDRIVMAVIGCQGMGSANMQRFMAKPEVEIAALCDVDEARLPADADRVEKKYGRRPALYKDFRKLLERKDIDAVVIATPDHWHALPLIYACEAGKDAYCEKPISHDITEARAMDAAVKKFKRIVQVGTWQRSTREFTDALAYVRSGKLGKIVQTRAWKTDSAKVGKVAVTTPPSSLDYDFWTGPAELLPYSANRNHYNWRWFLNYGTGMTGDWGVHMMDIALLGMSQTTDIPMPVEVTSYGGKYSFPDDDRTAPDTVQTLFRFKDPDYVMHWHTGQDHPGLPDQGTEFIGADGRTVRVWRGGWKVLDPAGKELEAPPAERTNDHWQNFLDCMKSREQPRSNLASMAQTTIVCHLANVSYLAEETVRWNKEKMDLVGKAGRDTQSYYREYRKPWKLPMHKI